MANVTTRQIVAGGQLFPGQEHDWWWKINPFQVWWFWADAETATQEAAAKFEIVRTYSEYVYIKQVGYVRRAHVVVKNVGSISGYYNLYVATAWPIPS